MEKFSRVAKNAILGDGTIRVNKDTAAMTYISTDLKLLEHKEKLLNEEGLSVTVKKTQTSGYGGTKTIYVYATTPSEAIKEAVDVGIETLLQDLTKEDLYLWYLDDGSWHKNANTMHLYSNMLDEHQSNILMNRIEELYGVRPRLNTDRKQDGRSFYYLYFSRELVRIFRPEIKAYLMKYKIDSMYYKFGGLDYVEEKPRFLSDEEVRTIRSLSKEGNSIKEVALLTGKTYDQTKRVISRNSYKNVI